MKNILLLMGRGVEGTGNTRITIELEEYLRSQGYNVWTIAASDKDWGRIKSQENDIILHSFAKEPYVSNIIPDIVLITSVPAKEKLSSNAMKNNKDNVFNLYENFTKTLEDLKMKGTKVVYLQVDHKIHSINRNYYVYEDYAKRFFPLIDRIISHDLNNDFFTKFIVNKINPLNIEGIHYDIREQLSISCDFDKEYSLITKREKIPGLCYFIGRSARWKGWREFRDFHYNYLMHNDFISIIEGIETSINAKQDLYDEIDGKLTHSKDSNIVLLIYCKDDKNIYQDLQELQNSSHRYEIAEKLVNNIKENPTLYKNKPIFVCGPYNRREALNRLSQAKFGMFFTFIGEDYSGPLENTFLEIVASGTIPVIRKELYDCAKFNGLRFSNFNPDDIGILIYDQNNPLDCLNKMKLLDKDDIMYNTYLNNITSFCKDNFDRNVILKRLTNLLDLNN